MLVRGLPFGLPGLEREAAALANVELGGPFRAPDDLPALYGSVDLVWACYPWSSGTRGNASMARTNRFYEACYFGRPMITLAGTEDARAVVAAGIGAAMDLSDVESAAATVAAIDRPRIDAWRAAIERLPPRTYLLTDEHERLARALRGEGAG